MSVWGYMYHMVCTQYNTDLLNIIPILHRTNRIYLHTISCIAQCTAKSIHAWAASVSILVIIFFSLSNLIYPRSFSSTGSAGISAAESHSEPHIRAPCPSCPRPRAHPFRGGLSSVRCTCSCYISYILL